MKAEVPFGTGTLGFEIPRGLEVEIPAPPALPEEDPVEAARKALAAPAGSPPLEQKARGSADALIAVPDATRAFPTGRILPLLLEALGKAGIPPAKVTVLAALGLHRGTTEEERAAILGAAAGSGVLFFDHDPRTGIHDYGPGPGGVPLRVSERAAAAAFVLSLGIVEPHAYAGFSGGWKTVGIGCAGEEFIAFTHAPRFLSHPRCRPGITEGNPFAAAVKENARKAGTKFALNLVPGIAGGAVAAAAGDPGVVHRLLSGRALQAFALPVKTPADVAVAGVGAPKDANLYQSTRAATNLVFAPVEAVRPGGVLILPVPCPEGVGRGEGELRFAAALRGGREALLKTTDRPSAGGEQRAWMTARVMASRSIVVVGSSLPAEELAAMGFGWAATVEEALAAAVAKGAKRLLVVPRALRALPVAPGGRP